MRIKSLKLTTRLSRHRLRSPPVFAIKTRDELYTRSVTHLSSSMVLLLASFAHKVCYNPFHSTISCHVLPCDALSTLSATPECNMRKKDDQSQNQRPPRPHPSFVENWDLPNSLQKSSFSGQNTPIFNSAGILVSGGKVRAKGSREGHFVKHFVDRYYRRVIHTEPLRNDEDKSTLSRNSSYVHHKLAHFLFPPVAKQM